MRLLERVDGLLPGTGEAGRMPSSGKVAMLAIVGDEDGAHHVSGRY